MVIVVLGTTIQHYKLLQVTKLIKLSPFMPLSFIARKAILLITKTAKINRQWCDSVKTLHRAFIEQAEVSVRLEKKEPVTSFVRCMQSIINWFDYDRSFILVEVSGLSKSSKPPILCGRSYQTLKAIEIQTDCEVRRCGRI
ncbi:hypothetical protein EDC94DRAFT_652745 [Helicostylum pulchrum]|nr:hypothetical protein EDC94DRAFT_652745 [Helicostylum pulchrum]